MKCWTNHTPSRKENRMLNIIVKYFEHVNTQPAFTCSKVTIKTLEQRCKICSKLTIKTPKRRQSCHFDVFIVNFEHISHLCSSISIVNFEHVIAGWVDTSLKMIL